MSLWDDLPTIEEAKAAVDEPLAQNIKGKRVWFAGRGIWQGGALPVVIPHEKSKRKRRK